MKKLLFFLLIFLNFNSIVFSEESFYIDWINGRIYSIINRKVKGDHNFANNSLVEMQNAQGIVKVNFYKALKQINIFESVSVLDYFEESSEKYRELFSLIDNATLDKVEYPEINSIKLTYYINIFGKTSLMNILMEERDIYTEDLKGYMGYHYETQYTGIIIDARGELTSFDGYSVKVKPSLFIVVKDSEGRIVFDKNNIYPEIIREKGMVRYSYNVYEDLEDRVGKNPFRLVADGVGDKSGGIIVVTEIDAKKMLSSTTTRKAINNGNIVIIIDN